MTSIRKILYAGLLALSTMSLAPTCVSAQEPAHGKFTLPHEVYWQNAVVPAGDYYFSLASNGPSVMLTLSQMDKARSGFMMLVNDIDQFTVSNADQLVINKTPRGSYVRSLELPKLGIALHFAVPSTAGQKIMAKSVTAPAAAGQ